MTVLRSPHLIGMISTAASLPYTTLALRSLFQFTELKEGDEIVVIDNDGSGEELAEMHHPRVRRIVPEKPLGFAENGNIFMREALASQRDLVFANNDLVFSPNWLEVLASCDDAISIPATNREVSYALAVAMPREDNEPQLFTLSMTMEREDMRNKYYAFQAIAEFHASRMMPNRKVLVLPFACVRIPLSVIRTIGGFDSSFGRAGAEDYDYCLRAHLAGIPVVFAERQLILHFGGRSSWGVERTDEQEAREELFRRRFREKWGEGLSALILREQDVTSGDPVLHRLYHPERLGPLIRELLRREGIAEPEQCIGV